LFVCEHSKHRPLYSPPHTPPEFWDIKIPDDNDRNEKYVDNILIDDDYNLVTKGKEGENLKENNQKWILGKI
jgi:hypothetical protein